MYYYNSVTMESVWDRPQDMGPSPPGGMRQNQGFYRAAYGGSQGSQGYGQNYGGPSQSYGYDAVYGPGPIGAGYGGFEGGGHDGPGAPIQKSKQAQGPPGSNLFVFHIPNALTTKQLHDMFAPFGNVISCRIMVERDTMRDRGRSRGFGFVSYDNAESAEASIRALDGMSVLNKRLKVTHKKEIAGEGDPEFGGGNAPIGGGFNQGAGARGSAGGRGGSHGGGRGGFDHRGFGNTAFQNNAVRYGTAIPAGSLPKTEESTSPQGLEGRAVMEVQNAGVVAAQVQEQGQ